MMKEAEEQAMEDMTHKRKGFFGAAPKNQLKTFLDTDNNNDDLMAYDTKPIADLFPHTTVMFADVSVLCPAAQSVDCQLFLTPIASFSDRFRRRSLDSPHGAL